jgi:hypothetical protein
MSFICLGIIAYAIYHLANNNTEPTQKLLWLSLIILIPIFGALIYLGTEKRKNKKESV